MAKLTVSLAQMNITLGDQRKNYTTMERWTAAAAQRQSRLVVLPELWSTGFDLEHAQEHASEISKGMFAQLSKVATQHKVVLVGSLLEKRGVEVANSAPLFAPTGRMLGVYRKAHLFPGMHEPDYLQPGAAAFTIDLPWGPTATAICYDLRFPELFRKYVIDEKAVMVIVPAAWPLARIDHWRALLIARAIENQCYIIACNAAGETGDTVYGGHSMIVDPWGQIVIEAGTEPQLITAEIEMDRVAEIRQAMPVLDEVRFDIYG